MRWRWWRRETPTVPVGPLEGSQARQRAEKALEQTIREREATEAQTPTFRALGESLRHERETNHFSALFRAIHEQRG